MATQQEIRTEIVRILRALQHAEGERRTMLYRDLADQTVDLREHYLTPAGQPDWTGRTGAYRIAVRALYAEAGYSQAERKVVQTSTRYHIGNHVRARISKEEADALALNPQSPLLRARERSRSDRQELRDLIAQARAIVEAHQQQPEPGLAKSGRRRAQ
ncbi:hypothetical protein BDK92_0117 [Micromonospora pisi]|uniref:Uncharacterized protein n=1 Tax=Micromonospora pisi TaxID=589240 RepID=A0A495JC04_9ACTN|nr:hypothetical protein [Micromonospora pisi]RKR85902.1 hypothetical protein BDK92_0117 [Micromonospora pisi]